MVQPVFAADVITNQNFLKVIQQSDRYQDVAVKISGKIVTSYEGESITGYAFDVGGIDNEKLGYMWLWDDRTDRPTLENDCFVVEGFWDGRILPAESFGSEFPLVWLTGYTEIECLPAEFPAIASGKHQGSDWKQELINPNMGCVSADPDIQCTLSWPMISLESVELTSDHMRTFFTIDNVDSSFGEVRQYEWDHIVVQDRRQFEVLHAHSSINTLGNIIPVGIIEDGWLLFEPIEPKPFEIRIVLKSFTTFDEYTLVFNVDDFDIVPTSMPTFTSSAPTPTPAPTSTNEVIVQNAPGSSTPGCQPNCFIPSTVTIDVGGTVTWENHDTSPHNTTSGSLAGGPSGVWDSNLITMGKSFSFTFDTAGSYDYFCMIHPWMEGKVIVKASSSTSLHLFQLLQL